MKVLTDAQWEVFAPLVEACRPLHKTEHRSCYALCVDERVELTCPRRSGPPEMRVRRHCGGVLSSPH